MSASFAIGDFSRATHLTVKTLRHYHETGSLQRSLVDQQTGYRLLGEILFRCQEDQTFHGRGSLIKRCVKRRARHTPDTLASYAFTA